MQIIGIALYIASIITSLVCVVMVLIQLFKTEGVGLGILGIFCGLYTYIWGWMKAKQLGLKNVMIAWTAAIVGMVAAAGLTAVATLNDPEVQAQMKKMQDLHSNGAQFELPEAPTPPEPTPAPVAPVPPQ